MEKTLDVPIFRVSRTIVTDKFDALYKVGGVALFLPLVRVSLFDMFVMGGRRRCGCDFRFRPRHARVRTRPTDPLTH